MPSDQICKQIWVTSLSLYKHWVALQSVTRFMAMNVITLLTPKGLTFCLTNQHLLLWRIGELSNKFKKIIISCKKTLSFLNFINVLILLWAFTKHFMLLRVDIWPLYSIFKSIVMPNFWLINRHPWVVSYIILLKYRWQVFVAIWQH